VAIFRSLICAVIRVEQICVVIRAEQIGDASGFTITQRADFVGCGRQKSRVRAVSSDRAVVLKSL